MPDVPGGRAQSSSATGRPKWEGRQGPTEERHFSKALEVRWSMEQELAMVKIQRSPAEKEVTQPLLHPSTTFHSMMKTAGDVLTSW